MASSPPVNGTVAYRVERLERDMDGFRTEVKELQEKIDRLILSVVAAALTIAGSVLVFAVTLLATGGST